MAKNDMKEKKPFLPEFLTKKKESTGPTETYSSASPTALPGINLIPQAVLDGYALKELQKRFIQIVVAVLVLVLVLGGVLFGIQKITEIRVAAAEKEAQAYAQQVKELQPYENYRDSVQAKRKSIGEKMSTEVDTGRVMNELQAAAKASGVKLSDNINVSVQTGETATTEGGQSSGSSSEQSCTSANPFNTQPSIGCASFTGKGNRAQISSFLQKLDENKHFNSAFVPSTSEGETSEFSGSVNFTGEFLTNNYSNLLENGEKKDATPTQTEGATTP